MLAVDIVLHRNNLHGPRTVERGVPCPPTDRCTHRVIIREAQSRECIAPV
jgi:hypothetical protein